MATTTPNYGYDKPASPEAVARAVAALRQHNIEAQVVADRAEALHRLQEEIPQGAEVMTGSSATLQQIGFMAWLSAATSVRYLSTLIRAETDPAARAELRRRAATADVAVGSVHGISETGEVVILSATGSQLGAFLSSRKVVWVAGTQKIVPTLEDAIKRAREYSMPLEDQRVRAGGGTGTRLGKMLVFAHEGQSGRIKLLLVPELLGF